MPWLPKREMAIRFETTQRRRGAGLAVQTGMRSSRSHWNELEPPFDAIEPVFHTVETAMCNRIVAMK